jgi:hypothetical protein
MDRMVAANRAKNRKQAAVHGAYRVIVATWAFSLMVPLQALRGAGVTFTETQVPGKHDALLSCDLDGDGLADMVRIEGTVAHIYFQDVRQGFAPSAHLAHPLAQVPTVLWSRPGDKAGGSLLLLTHEGLSELSCPARAAPARLERIIARPTMLPAAVDGGRSIHSVCLSARGPASSLFVFVPPEGSIEVWQCRERRQRVQEFAGAVSCDISALDDPVGYRKKMSVDVSVSDLNGDGLDDVVISTGQAGRTRFQVYVQTREGPRPFVPVASWSGSWDGQSTWMGWVDVNRDGKIDLVQSTWLREPWFLPGLRSGKVLIQVFLADAQGQPAEKPQYVLRKSDWMPALPLVDVDGDGFVDMVLGYSPFSTRDGHRKNLGAGQLDHTLRFHFFRPETGYLEEPDCQADLLLSMNTNAVIFDVAHVPLLDTLINLSGDFDGDGRLDLLVRDDPASVSVYPFVSRARGFGATPLARFEHPGPVEATVVKDLNGDRISDCVILDKESVKVFLSRRE